MINIRTGWDVIKKHNILGFLQLTLTTTNIQSNELVDFSMTQHQFDCEFGDKIREYFQYPYFFVYSVFELAGAAFLW